MVVFNKKQDNQTLKQFAANYSYNAPG